MTDRYTIFRLDIFPPGSALNTDIDRPNSRVRFQAVEGSGTDRQRKSKWSGWFPLADCPVLLEWVAFDFGED